MVGTGLYDAGWYSLYRKIRETDRSLVCGYRISEMGDDDVDGSRNDPDGSDVWTKEPLCRDVYKRQALSASEAFSSPVSPPPFMVGIAEVEVDKLTGAVELIDYAAVVDCGTPINPNLARVQTEGGIAQGIGMALYEDIVYNDKGKNYSNSFMQYKIPSRLDVGTIRVDFESSYEPTGPFGAKSIGEDVYKRQTPQIVTTWALFPIS